GRFREHLVGGVDPGDRRAGPAVEERERQLSVAAAEVGDRRSIDGGNAGNEVVERLRALPLEAVVLLRVPARLAHRAAARTNAATSGCRRSSSAARSGWNSV